MWVTHLFFLTVRGFLTLREKTLARSWSTMKERCGELWPTVSHLGPVAFGPVSCGFVLPGQTSDFQSEESFILSRLKNRPKKAI